MIALLVMVVASAALSFAAVLTARRLRTPADSGLEHALTVALLVVVSILVVSLPLGLVGLYRPLPLLAAALALAAVVARLARAPNAPNAPSGDRPSERRRRLRGAPAALAGLARREPLAAVAVALAGVAVLNRALMALLLPPQRYDELAYHLIFVGDWVQRGTIGGSELQRGTCCAWYPVNAEIAYGWLAVFLHSDRLVGLAQIGFLVLGGLATASIARSVGAPDRYAVAAGSLFVLTPVALRQADSNLVDVALAGGVLLTVAFLLRILTAPAGAARGDVVRFALAAAVTLGIKATAFPYVAVACVVLAGHTLLERRRAPAGRPWRPVLQAAAVVAALAVLGSGWYVRAWAATGNPLWPYHVEVLDRVVFAGWKDPAEANPTPARFAGLPGVLHTPRSWLEDVDVDLSLRTDPHGTDTRLGGLGLVWLFVGIPGAVAALVLTLRRRDPRFLLFALVVGPAALFGTPDAWLSRFVIPLAAVGLVGYAYTAGRLPSPAARTVTAAAVALSVIGVIETRPLAGLQRVLDTPGAPLERPRPRPDDRAYVAIHALPREARVGVVTGSPLLPYLVLGGEFSRTVVPLRTRPESGEELARFLEASDVEYLVTRDPLPRSLVDGAGLALVRESTGASVYRRGDDPSARGPASI